jgi:oxygen-dependent protoporphyrinogen oxidase
LLSTGAKLRLPRLLFEVWRRRAILDPLRPERAAAIDGDDMATFLRRVVGDEAFEYALAPAFSSTFDSDPEDLSGAFALLTLRFLQQGFRLQSFDGGTGRLTQALAQRLTVRTGCEVTRIDGDRGGARVHYRLDGAPYERGADHVVVAVPGSLVAALCPSLTADEAAFFAAVRYVRGIIVFLMLEQAPATLPYYGVAFLRREGIGLYGLAVDHHKAGVCPPGSGLLNAALTAGAAARLWERSDEAIVAFVLDQLARTPVGRLSRCDAAVHRWAPMLPQFHAGYLPRLRAFLERRTRTPRLVFAGDYLVGPYTEAALTSGLRAAGEIG